MTMASSIATSAVADVTSLKKGDYILVKHEDADDWDCVVYSVSKDVAANSTVCEFKPKFIRDAAIGTFVQINTGLACNLPKFGSQPDYSFKRVQTATV